MKTAYFWGTSAKRIKFRVAQKLKAYVLVGLLLSPKKVAQRALAGEMVIFSKCKFFKVQLNLK